MHARALPETGKISLNKEPYKMAEFEKQTVTIDDVDYYYEDLPQGVQHAIAQIGYTRNMIEESTLEIQKYEMMQRGYTEMLKEEMEKFKAGE